MCCFDMFGHNYCMLELLLLNINMIKVRGKDTSWSYVSQQECDYGVVVFSSL